MSDEINIPNCPENKPANIDNTTTQLVCDLRVKGSEVYLPQTNPVDFKSEEYEKVFLNALPDDIASEVSSVLKAKRSHFTVLSLIINFLFLSVLAFVFYCLYPKMHFSSTSDLISRDGLTISDKYEAITSKANEEIKQKQWKAAIATLEDYPKKISGNEKETLDNLLMFRLYFDAINNYVDAPSDLKSEARSIIDQVRNHSPDRLGWYLDWLRLNYSEECNCLSHGRVEPNADRAKNIKSLFLDVNPARWKNAPDYKNNNIRLLDLYYARLNFMYWCYCDPQNNKDETDPGVLEREDAYEICKKYTREDQSIDRDFLQLRIDIIKTIKHAGIGLGEGYYYFDGGKKWLASTIQKELDKQLNKLEALEKQK